MISQSITGGEGDAIDIAQADRARDESDIRYAAAVVDAMIAGDAPIVAWRKYRGLSQAALAERSGITRAAISRLERTALGGHDVRLAIARALDVPIAALDPLND